MERILPDEPIAVVATGERMEDKIPPNLCLDVDGYRLIMFIDYAVLGADVVIDAEATKSAFDNWIKYGGPLMLSGISRVEIYKL